MKSELLELGDKTSLEFYEFMAQIERPTEPDSGTFFHIVAVLSDAARGNYQDLRGAYLVDNQTVAAWSCRNLLEIAVFTKFALKSRENSVEFAADRLIDGYQISKSLQRLVSCL